MGLPVVNDEQLERLTEAAHFVAEVVNVSPWVHQPYVGRSAFAHKGGLHIAAVRGGAADVRARRSRRSSATSSAC